jgi:hypothetical protein
MEVDALVARLFDKYFGDAADPYTQAAYLEAMFRCGTQRWRAIAPAPTK